MENVITSLTWEKSTKGTHLYKEDDVYDTLSIRNMYLCKAFAEEGGKAPKKLGVIIAELEEGESLMDFTARMSEELG